MVHFEIPGREPFDIDTVIFDLNGTLTIDGQIVPGVSERMGPLRDKYAKLFLFTGDTLGNGARIAEELGLQVRITPNAESKAAEAKKLRPETTATIGNGRIDLELFQTVKLAIAALQGEGLHGSLLWVPDIIIVPTINDGLDLLLKEKRLIATLRK